jgi:hypothetical protein
MPGTEPPELYCGRADPVDRAAAAELTERQHMAGVDCRDVGRPMWADTSRRTRSGPARRRAYRSAGINPGPPAMMAWMGRHASHQARRD